MSRRTPAATATVDNGRTRLVNAIESVYYHSVGETPGSSNMNAIADVDNDADSAETPLVFAVFPNEVLMAIINSIPLNDLMRIMSVNKTVCWLVQTSASFKRLLESVPNAIQLFCSLKMGNMSLSRTYHVL